MEPLVVSLILLSAFIHAVWNFLGKKSLDHLVFFWWLKIFEFLIYLPLSVYLFLSNVVSAFGWSILVVSGITHLFYWTLLGTSYRYGDLSIVYPIARSAPIFVSIFAVLFLNETLSLIGILGITSVMLGAYLLPMEALKAENLFRPFTHLRSKTMLLAFSTALSVAAYSLVDKVGAQYVHPVLYVWVENLISLVLLTPLVITFSKVDSIREEWEKNKWAAFFGGFLCLLSYSLIILAMRMSQVSYIVSIRQVSVVFGVILGSLLLGERHLKVRLFSSTLIFIGLVFVSIA